MARLRLGGPAGSDAPPEGGHPSGETLSTYVDGELDVDSRADVDQHLRICARCRGQVNDFRSASDLFRRVPAHRVPMSVRRDLYRKLDEQESRRRSVLFGLPLPSANVMGLALTAVLLALIGPQLLSVWAVISSNGGRVAERAAAVEVPPVPTLGAVLPTDTADEMVPPVQPTSVPPTPVPDAGSAAAGAPPPGPSPTSAPIAPPVVVATSPAAASAPASPVATATRPPQPTATRPAPTVQPTATSPTLVTRAIAGQVTNVNKAQRQITVQTGPSAEGGARPWNVVLTEGTLITFRDGRRLQLDDVGFADYVEVSGFEMSAGPLMAASVKVTQSAVQNLQSRPKVLVLMDGAPSIRTPQFGFTGDWIKRLNETGYDVTPADPSSLTGTTNLKDFALIAIGYPATMPNDVLQNVRNSRIPVLNADPRLVQALGMGLNVDPMNPVKMVSGRTVDVAGSASPVTRGFSGDTIVGGELYRTPIVSNGTVLATITDGGQRRAVWSVTGNVMYFGFWYSANGQNHNATYWTLFDRSVLLLTGKDPLSAPAR